MIPQPYIILDLEAACWERGSHRDRMETIEFGAVRLAGDPPTPRDEFARFVRPGQEPVLSDFCTRLTGITQADVDGAATFPVVFAEFLQWCGDEPFRLCSWGRYDVNQLRRDCQQHGLPFPARLENHVNLKVLFATWRGIRPCGMKKALNILRLPLVGRHHRGIDDARNIAAIALAMIEQGVVLE